MQLKVLEQFCSFVYDNADKIHRKDSFEENAFSRKNTNVFGL